MLFEAAIPAAETDGVGKIALQGEVVGIRERHAVSPVFPDGILPVAAVLARFDLEWLSEGKHSMQ